MNYLFEHRGVQYRLSQRADQWIWQQRAGTVKSTGSTLWRVRGYYPSLTDALEKVSYRLMRIDDYPEENPLEGFIAVAHECLDSLEKIRLEQ